MVTGAAEDEFHDRASAQDFLRALACRAEPWPLGLAALALAALDRPRVDLARYRHHLASLAREVGEQAAAADDPERRIAALNAVLMERYGYQGDTLTYEDLQNANLMRVIDRRKGLPVALGILYIDAGRAQGWDMAGLAFPGHFLLRLDDDGTRLIIDPFHEGRVRQAAELRDLLKTMAGNDAELTPAHYAVGAIAMCCCACRTTSSFACIESRQLEKALAVIDGMLLFAPDDAALWREAGVINAELGQLQAAIGALGRFLALADSDAARHHAAALIERLRKRLQ